LVVALAIPRHPQWHWHIEQLAISLFLALLEAEEAVQ